MSKHLVGLVMLISCLSVNAGDKKLDAFLQKQFNDSTSTVGTLVIKFVEDMSFSGYIFGRFYTDPKETPESVIITTLNDLLDYGGQVICTMQLEESSSDVVYKTRYTSVKVTNVWYIKIVKPSKKK